MASTVPALRAAARARPAFGATDVGLLAMAVIWGINYSVVKYGASVVPPLVFNGARLTIAGVVLLLASLVAGRRAWPSPSDTRSLLLLGLLGNGLYQLLFILGVSYTRAGTVAILLAASPAVIAIFGRALGQERIGRRAAAGIALSIAGVACVIAGGAGDLGGHLAGTLIVLAACICWSLYNVLLRPYAQRVGNLQLTAITIAGGAVPLALLALPGAVAMRWSTVPLAAYGALLYGSLGALVVAGVLWYRGVRTLGPTRAALYSNLQPAIAVAFAWATLGEVPTPWQLAGAAAITAGIVVTRS